MPWRATQRSPIVSRRTACTCATKRCVRRFVSMRERPALSARLTSADDQGWQPGFGLPGLHEYPGAAIEYKGELVVSGWLYSAGTKTGDRHRALDRQRMGAPR
jgi:hypothetical protein